MKNHARTRNEDGVAAVELALVLPLLLMLAFGIIAFGVGFNQQLIVTRATREAVRTMAITDNSATAVSAAHSAAPSLDPGQMTVVLTGCGPTPGTDDVATADISYPYSYTIPLLGTKNVSLTSHAVMHCGG